MTTQDPPNRSDVPPEAKSSPCATSPSRSIQQGRETTSLRRGPIILLAFVALIVAAIAGVRVGMLDLPSPPRGVTAASAGLAHLDMWAGLDRYIRAKRGAPDPASLGVNDVTLAAARLARAGLARIETGDEPTGLGMVARAVRTDPTNLVLGNAYRMAVFRLQRAYLSKAHERGVLTPAFPDHLKNQPMALFESLSRETNAREVRLQLALAWVDKMLLFPALEIKAPSSVESVKLLTEIIDDHNAGYVPALFARGLNHLHRPARLVWPESDKTPPDAAARDIGLCVAIGRRLGVGSARLQARLATALGDAYVKAGRLSVARSWWQIAQNLCGDTDVYEAVRERFGWSDEETLDRLERELDRARSELDTPMTDLAMMWE